MPIIALPRRAFLHQLALASTAAALAPRALAQTAAPSRSASAATGERKLGVALLGLGRYATRQLLPALQQTKFCRLAGVVTGEREKGMKWSAEHGFPEKAVYSYETMDRLADDKSIDIVYVVTPPGTHRDFVVRAAKAGKHVICEKPMATKVADCDAMIAACRDAKRHLSIGYRLHFDPHNAELKRLGREKSFGALKSSKGGFGFRIKEKEWRLDKKLAGGGPVPDVGTYVIQAACMAAGGVAPVAVTARDESEKKRPELFSEVEDTMRFELEFPDGTKCEGFTSYESQMNEFRGEFARGWIELKPAFSYGGLAARTHEGPLKVENVPQQTRQIDDFAQCVLTGRATPVGGDMGRRDVAIIEAIYASAAAGGKRLALKA